MYAEKCILILCDFQAQLKTNKTFGSLTLSLRYIVARLYYIYFFFFWIQHHQKLIRLLGLQRVAHYILMIDPKMTSVRADRAFALSLYLSLPVCV